MIGVKQQRTVRYALWFQLFVRSSFLPRHHLETSSKSPCLCRK